MGDSVGSRGWNAIGRTLNSDNSGGWAVGGESCNEGSGDWSNNWRSGRSVGCCLIEEAIDSCWGSVDNWNSGGDWLGDSAWAV